MANSIKWKDLLTDTTLKGVCVIGEQLNSKLGSVRVNLLNIIGDYKKRIRELQQSKQSSKALQEYTFSAIAAINAELSIIYNRAILKDIKVFATKNIHDTNQIKLCIKKDLDYIHGEVTLFITKYLKLDEIKIGDTTEVADTNIVDLQHLFRLTTIVEWYQNIPGKKVGWDKERLRNIILNLQRLLHLHKEVKTKLVSDSILEAEKLSQDAKQVAKSIAGLKTGDIDIDEQVDISTQHANNAFTTFQELKQMGERFNSPDSSIDDIDEFLNTIKELLGNVASSKQLTINAVDEFNRLTDEKAKRLAAEEEANRLAELEATRKAAEENARLIAKEAARVAAEKLAAEQEAARLAAEQERARLAVEAEAAARLAAEVEAAKEAARLAAEEAKRQATLRAEFEKRVLNIKEKCSSAIGYLEKIHKYFKTITDPAIQNLKVCIQDLDRDPSFKLVEEIQAIIENEYVTALKAINKSLVDFDIPEEALNSIAKELNQYSVDFINTSIKDLIEKANDQISKHESDITTLATGIVFENETLPHVFKTEYSLPGAIADVNSVDDTIKLLVIIEKNILDIGYVQADDKAKVKAIVDKDKDDLEKYIVIQHQIDDKYSASLEIQSKFKLDPSVVTIKSAELLYGKSKQDIKVLESRVNGRNKYAQEALEAGESLEKAHKESLESLKKDTLAKLGDIIANIAQDISEKDNIIISYTKDIATTCDNIESRPVGGGDDIEYIIARAKSQLLNAPDFEKEIAIAFKQNGEYKSIVDTTQIDILGKAIGSCQVAVGKLTTEKARLHDLISVLESEKKTRDDEREKERRFQEELSKLRKEQAYLLERLHDIVDQVKVRGKAEHVAAVNDLMKDVVESDSLKKQIEILKECVKKAQAILDSLEETQDARKARLGNKASIDLQKRMTILQIVVVFICFGLLAFGIGHFIAIKWINPCTINYHHRYYVLANLIALVLFVAFTMAYKGRLGTYVKIFVIGFITLMFLLWLTMSYMYRYNLTIKDDNKRFAKVYMICASLYIVGCPLLIVFI